jgi:hypothetical protein
LLATISHVYVLSGVKLGYKPLDSAYVTGDTLSESDISVYKLIYKGLCVMSEPVEPIACIVSGVT